MVTTSKPSIAACRAQIGSTSVTSTRAPYERMECEHPLPTSPYPQTTTTLPAIITSVARLIPSAKDFAAAVKVIEFGFRYRVVYIECREQQFTFFLHLIQTMYACSRFFRNTTYFGCYTLPASRTLQPVRTSELHSVLFHLLHGLLCPG